jgi:hypothetical protein
MQHILFPAIKAMLLCVALLFTGNAPAEPAPFAVEQVSGNWSSSEQVPDQGLVETLMTVHPDGTFSGSLLVNNETAWTFSGNWTLNGNTIHWAYTESSLVLLVEDSSEVDTILALDQDAMTLKSGRRGDVRTLRRVK